MRERRNKRRCSWVLRSGLEQTRSFRDVGSMSGLPESGNVLRQLFVNAAIAPSAPSKNDESPQCQKQTNAAI